MGTYDATYTYFTKDFANERFVKHSARCVVLKETVKSYLIRLKAKIPNHAPEEQLWVRKKSILRSYLNLSTGLCDLYGLTPAEESCRACLQRCYRRLQLNNV